MKPVIKRPLITENSLALAKEGWYTFVVDCRSRKPAIAQAVEKQYKVDVREVRTAIMEEKTRSVGPRRRKVTQSDWKKARVRLGKGQHIEAFEVTEEEKK